MAPAAVEVTLDSAGHAATTATNLQAFADQADAALAASAASATTKADAAAEFARQRANHIGAQGIGTVTGLQAALDSKPTMVNGKLPTSTIPAQAINETFAADSQAEMLATPASVGDVVLRTDTPSMFQLTALPPSTLANWLERPIAGGGVSSVNTQTGVVVLGKADVELSAVDNVSAANLRDRSTHTGAQDIGTVTGLQVALDSKADKAGAVLNVRDFGALGNNTGNDQVAIQAAIDSLPTSGTFIGGTVYLPRGIYRITAPIALRNGVRLVGEGQRASRISVASGTGLFTWTGALSKVNIENLYLSGASGHLFAPTNGTSGISSTTIQDCTIVQSATGSSIFYHVSSSDYDNVNFLTCDLQMASGATVPAFYLVNSGGALNENRWENCWAHNNGVSSAPFFYLESTAPTSYAYGNVFRNITCEQNPGGLIHLFNNFGPVIDGVHGWDTVTYTDDLIKLGTSASASALRTRYATVSNSGRRGGTLAAGKYDINLVPSATSRCTLISPNHSSEPTSGLRINMSESDSHTLIGVPPQGTVWATQPANVGSFFGPGVKFAGGMFVGNSAEPATPAAGSVLFAAGDVLKYKTPSGSVGTVGRGDLYLDVRDYGVKGDGTTDDTAALNTLFSALPATGGATVFFPVGTYLVNSVTATRVLLLTGKRDIRLLGADLGAHITTSSAVCTDLLRIENCERFEMENLRFSVSGTAKVTNVVAPSTTSPGSAHFHDYKKIFINGVLGAAGARRAWDATFTSGSKVVWSAQGGQTDYQGGSPWQSVPFAVADVGRLVTVNVPGKDPFYSTVVSVARYTATLASGINSTTLTIPLTAPLTDQDGNVAPTGGYTINIDNELFFVSSGGNTATLTCSSRGRGLVYPAATHNTGASVVTSAATLADNLTGTVSNGVGAIRVQLSTSWFINGFGVGSDSPGASNLDLAGLNWWGCVVFGAAGAAWVMGNGTTANVLNMYLSKCSSYECGFTVHANGTNFVWDGGGTATNLILFKRTHPGGDPVVIRDVRTDGAAVLWESAQGATVGPSVSIENVAVNAYNASDGIVINHTDSTPIYMKNLDIQYPLGQAVKIVTLGTSGSPCYMVAENVATTSGSGPFISTGSGVRRFIIPGPKRTAPAQTLGPDVVGGVVVDHKWLFGGGARFSNTTEPATPTSGVELFSAGDVLKVKTPSGAVTSLGGVTLNVKDYGAKGDGTTDDTAAIQAAFDALPVAAGNEIGGGTVLFPKGVYVCDTVTGGVILTLLNKPNVCLVGVGASSRIRATTATATELLRIESCTSFIMQNLMVQVIGTAKIGRAVHYTTSDPGSAHFGRFNNVVIGANGTYRNVGDVSTVSGSPTIYSASAEFTSGDVGGVVTIDQSNGPVFSTIQSVATLTGTLAANVNSSATTLTLNAVIAGAPASGYSLKVGNERMLVTGGGNTAALTVVRGRGVDLVAEAHTAGDAVTGYAATLADNATQTISNAVAPARIQPAGSAVMQEGLCIGVDHPGSAALDIANTDIEGLAVQRAAVAGVRVGNGTSGNNLNHWAKGYSAVECGYGVFMAAGALSLHGSDFDNNLFDVRRFGVCSSPLKISDIRTESSFGFYSMTGSATIGPPTTLDTINIVTCNAEDGVPLRHLNSGTLVIDGMDVVGSTAIRGNLLAVIAGTTAAPCHVIANGVCHAGGSGDFFASVGAGIASARTAIKEITNQSRKALNGVVEPNTVSGNYSGNHQMFGGGFGRARTTVADANYTITRMDHLVAYTSLTAARVVTLPAQGGTLPAPQEFAVKDESGACDGAKMITIIPTSGTIDGAASLVLNTAYARVSIYTNGANWFTR